MKKNVHIRNKSKEFHPLSKKSIELNVLRVYLMLKCILRFGKRIIWYMKDIIPIIMCGIIFELIVIPIGLFLNKYKSWIDGIWDLRTFLLTSVLIVIVLKIYSSESERHKSLTKQYEVYESFKYASQRFVCSLCRIVEIEINHDFFGTDTGFDDFYETIKEKLECCFPEIQNEIIEDDYLLYSTKKIPREVVIKIYFKQYLRELDNVNNLLYAENFIGPMEHAVEQINYIYNELQAEECVVEEQASNYTDIQLLKFVDVISRCIYPAVKDLRHPWRWDFKIREKMCQIINN